MSSPTEDLHLRINALGAERTLQLLDAEQTRRARIEHENEMGLFYHPHRLQVSDSWDLSIGEVTNHPPRIDAIPNQTLDNTASAINVPVNIIDPDTTDTHTITIISRPGTWVSKLNNSTLRINPSGRTPGTYNVRIRVRDNGTPQGEDFADFSITIRQGNRAPVLSSVANRTITLGQTVRINLIATDLDNDDITYSKNKNVGNLNSSTGVFVWTPTSATQDTTIRFTAADGRGGTHSRDCTITINPRPVTPPSPPVLESIGNKSRVGAGRVSFVVRAKDPNGLDITFLPAARFGTATKDSQGRWSARYTSTSLAVGTHTATITARAAGGTPANETDAETINIIVSANRPPVLRAIGNKTVRRGETLTFTAVADDPEDDTITYSKTGVGSLGGSTGVFTYSPNNSVSLGNKTVKITATATGGSDSETITITVEAAPPLAATPPRLTRDTFVRTTFPSTDANKTIQGFYYVRDPDDLDITFSIQSGNIVLVGNATKAQTGPDAGAWGQSVRATLPAAGQTAKYTIRATAAGGNPANEYVDLDLSLTISEPDYSPNITITSPIDGTSIQRHSNGFASILARISATRYNGEAIPLQDLTVTQTGWPNTYTFNSVVRDTVNYGAHTRIWLMRNNQAATVKITASYTDTVNNRAYTTTKSVTVTVT